MACLAQFNHSQTDIPYRRDIYEPLNRKSPQIVRLAAASGLDQEFRTVLPEKNKIKNSTYELSLIVSTYTVSFNSFLSEIFIMQTQSSS